MNSNNCAIISKNIDNEINNINNMNIVPLDNTEYIKLDKQISDAQKLVEKNIAIDLERKTLILITKEKNKNIEIYYLIYLLFSVLFIIIQICILFLYNN